MHLFSPLNYYTTISLLLHSNSNFFSSRGSKWDTQSCVNSSGLLESTASGRRRALIPDAGHWRTNGGRTRCGSMRRNSKEASSRRWGQDARTSNSTPSPTNCLYAATACPVQPNCPRAALLASAMSASVSKSVPSRSNSTARSVIRHQVWITKTRRKHERTK